MGKGLTFLRHKGVICSGDANKGLLDLVHFVVVATRLVVVLQTGEPKERGSQVCVNLRHKPGLEMKAGQEDEVNATWSPQISIVTSLAVPTLTSSTSSTRELTTA